MLFSTASALLQELHQAEVTMEPGTASLMRLAELLGERIDVPLRIYLLGGSAMLLHGSPRARTDVDHDLAVDELDATIVQQTMSELADRLDLELEFVPLAQFVPLPAGLKKRTASFADSSRSSFGSSTRTALRSAGLTAIGDSPSEAEAL